MLRATAIGAKAHVTVAQNGIYMGMPSSGVIGNNGALSAITAHPLTYANCYLFFPANAIFVGSAAGMYYCQMSSTTAGTIFNNTYTSGIPTIPAVPTPFVTTGPGAYTQTTGAPITIWSVPLTGNSWGANGIMRIVSTISNAGSANAKLQQINLDGSVIQQVTQSTAANISTEWNTWGSQRGVTNSQVWGPLASPGFGVSTGANIQTSVDTTVTKNITGVMQLANAADWQGWEFFQITIMLS